MCCSPNGDAVVFGAQCFREITERTRLTELGEQLRAALEDEVRGGQDVGRWSALQEALQIWGLDKRNHDLVKTSAQNDIIDFGWILIANTWRTLWQDDEELIPTLLKVAKETNVEGAFARQLLQIMKPNDATIRTFLANVPPLQMKYDFGLAD